MRYSKTAKEIEKARRRALRQEMRDKRHSLTPDEVQRLSQAVHATLLAHPYLQAERTIASYMSFAGEIGTQSINQALKERGHELCLPVITETEKGLMDFFTYDQEEDLIANRYQILEPQVIEANYVAPEEMEVVLVPLVAFSLKGDRIGMGGGYYDRLLKKISLNCLTIGLAYDFQCCNDINSQSWDMPLDEVITPTQHHVFTKKY